MLTVGGECGQLGCWNCDTSKFRGASDFRGGGRTGCWRGALRVARPRGAGASDRWGHKRSAVRLIGSRPGRRWFDINRVSGELENWRAWRRPGSTRKPEGKLDVLLNSAGGWIGQRQHSLAGARCTRNAFWKRPAALGLSGGNSAGCGDVISYHRGQIFAPCPSFVMLPRYRPPIPVPQCIGALLDQSRPHPGLRPRNPDQSPKGLWGRRAHI